MRWSAGTTTVGTGDSSLRARDCEFRNPSREREPGAIAFAHRGGIHDLPGGERVRENSLEAFEMAIAAGATGIEADIWTTSDGECVIHHDFSVGRGLIPRPIWMASSSSLPDHVPTVDELYDLCGTSVEISLDSLSRSAGNSAIDSALSAGEGAPGRLWLCSFVYSHLMAWRKKSEEVKLVDSTPFHRPEWLLERRIAKAASAGLDAFNAHHSAWSERLVEHAHERGLMALAWDVNDRRAFDRIRALGIDAIYSDHLSLVVEFQDGA